MARRVQRDMTVEEFDDWSNASKKFADVAEAADEVGGPRLSLVTLPEQDKGWPTDLLPPAPDRRLRRGPSREQGGVRHCLRTEQASAAIPAMPFDGVPLESSRKRLAGWCVERQRLFLTVLAETGQVHLAAAAARLTVRSAQALRVRSPAFNAGWRMAEQLGAGQARAARLRPRDQRPRRAGLSGRRIDRRTAGAQRQVADVAARPARPQALRAAVGATRQCRSAGRGRRAFTGMLDCLSDTPAERASSLRTFANIRLSPECSGAHRRGEVVRSGGLDRIDSAIHSRTPCRAMGASPGTRLLARVLLENT